MSPTDQATAARDEAAPAAAPEPTTPSPYRAPSIEAPRGGGAIRGIGETFRPNPMTGTGAMTVPLALSHGRAGFEATLALQYDSAAGNGPFGFGWSLSTPSITRRTDRGLPRYDDAAESDVFILSGAEDLVPVLDAAGVRVVDDLTRPGVRIERYRPRLEGLFARIERWTDRATGDRHWRSIAKDNVTTVYGTDDSSRITHDGQVFSWLISETYDDRGNRMVYEYAAEDARGVPTAAAAEQGRQRGAQRYLRSIRYANRVSRLVDADPTHADFMIEVVLDYDEGRCTDVAPPAGEPVSAVQASWAPTAPWAARPDPFSVYRAGYEVRTHRRCRQVLVFHRFPELGGVPYLVSSQRFDYDDLDPAVVPTVDAERAHPGSTRYGSFLRAVTKRGHVRDTSAATPTVAGVPQPVYRTAELPPVRFEYSRPLIDATVGQLAPADAWNLPAGIDGSDYRLADLDGDGAVGMLTEQAGTWFYKANLGGGRFAAARPLPSLPNRSGLHSGAQLLDLGGDGRLDLVDLGGPLPGFSARTDDAEWDLFRAFEQRPAIAWDDPNLRFVDLDGDGLADVLITEDDAVVWHPSLADRGFGTAVRVPVRADEEQGPRLLIADGSQSVYLADMSGDGLTDLVRIRNGEVSYWPNLGYGRFGGRIRMDGVTLFDDVDSFDQRRLRIADLDGSGPSDLIYLGRDGARLYFNQAGNRFTPAIVLPPVIPADAIDTVSTADLFGTGTSCLIWSARGETGVGSPLRYLDLLAAGKPNLLVASENSLGSRTEIAYASATAMQLADKRAGRPWVTRLPVPVQVVERVTVRDQVSHTALGTRFTYRHGYFDEVEREFRGFALVEQVDEEVLDVDRPSPVSLPPTLTRSWFHTGAFLDRDRIATWFATVDGPDGYYHEAAATPAERAARLLPDTVLPAGLDDDERREACRALRGSLLRQEIFALDGTPAQARPYTTIEQNHGVVALQPRSGNRHAVFMTHPLETVTDHLERVQVPVAAGQIVAPGTFGAVPRDDPRTEHELTIDVDEFGNVLLAAHVGYPRRWVDPAVPDPATRAVQALPTFVATAVAVTAVLDDAGGYRAPLPYDHRRFEVTGAVPAAGGRFTRDAARTAVATAAELDATDEPTPGTLQRRLVDASRTLYRRNDLTGLCPPGTVESLALPGQEYKLVFTPTLLTATFGADVDAMSLAAGGYVQLAGDTGWWAPSNRVSYSPATGDSFAAEVGFAHSHFFLPRRFRTPFHGNPVSTESFVEYDAHDLLVIGTTDPLGTTVTVGGRDAAGNRTSVGVDYRVLSPVLVTDGNGNRTAVAFDALGMVVASAATAKPAPAPLQGDSLVGVEADPTAAQVAAFLTDPLGEAATLLGPASSRMVYDLRAFADRGAPTAVYTIRRETWASDPVPAGGTALQLEILYCDGVGRELQTKKRAEPGPVPLRGPDGSIQVGADRRPVMSAADAPVRWVGSGWKVYDGKGNVIKRYEPFFSDRAAFDGDAAIGLTPTVCHDPVGRVVATVRADHAWSKTVVGPWSQASWDANDTVLLDDPATDADVGATIAALPAADVTPTWHAARSGGLLGPVEQRAARRAAVHAATPTVEHRDPLGRTVLTVVHDIREFDSQPAVPTLDEFHVSRVGLDIDGKPVAVFDPLGRLVMRHRYDLLGRQLGEQSMEAGAHRTFADVDGRPVLQWDSTGRRRRSEYDALRRPTASLQRESGAAVEVTIGTVRYGESLPDPAAVNARGQAVEVRDQAGVVTSNAYDFKGNLLGTTRRFAIAFDRTLDWTGAEALDANRYATTTTFDALGRPVTRTLPDATVVRYRYNEAALLEQLDANLTGDPQATTFVAGSAYDAQGRRTELDLGNGTTTSFGYDEANGRLLTLASRRDPATFPGDDAQPGWPGRLVQNLTYVHDPVGNVSTVRDDAQQVVFFRNRRVDPSSDYTYDATYRLVEATGREHLGQVGGTPVPHSWNDAPRVGLAWSANDGNALGVYQERYDYDAAGNLQTMAHRGVDPAAAGWTRTFGYDEVSALEPTRRSNRLTTSQIGATTEIFSTAGDGYDPLGNPLRMPHLQSLQWDTQNRLQMVQRQAVGNGGTGERTWYGYDADGNRVRKTTVDAAGQLVDDRVYLGELEVYRHANGLVRDTVHVMDGPRRVAIVETRRAGVEPGGVPARMIRYQLGNQLGSSVLELDEQSRIVTYEEYSPFGSTVYQAGTGLTEVPKRYRFAGRERDDESGFEHHGKRYCAPWLARWISPDPAGLVDGPNLYRYVRDNPVLYTDPQGTDPVTGGADPPLVTGPVRLGPVQIGNVRGGLSGVNINGSFQLHDLWSSDRSVSIDRLDLFGSLRLSSDLSLPDFGLAGSGSYQLRLDGFRISHDHVSADVEGRASASSGPLRLTLEVGAHGETTLPSRIHLGNAAAELTGTLDQFHGWVGVHGRLEVGNTTVGRLTLHGDIGPGAQGSFDVNASVGVGGFRPGRLSGSGSFDGGTYNASGTFRLSLPPIAYAAGTWSAGSTGGFSATGNYVGPQLGPIGLKPNINPTGNVTDDTPTLRTLDAMHGGTDNGGAVYMFEPGPSVGFTHFHYSSTGTTIFSVGVSPTSSLVPYFRDGVSIPFGGPSTGPYVGAAFSHSF